MDVRGAVEAFWGDHYSANLMRLAVYGRETLDELQALVAEHFSGVADKRRPVPAFGADVFLPEQLGTLLTARFWCFV